MADRANVYAAIESEVHYQDALGANAGTPPEEVRPHSVEEFVVYMEDYLRELKTHLSRNWTRDRKPVPAAMHTLRKVVTLGVRAMEQHGAPMREDHEVLVWPAKFEVAFELPGSKI